MGSKEEGFYAKQYEKQMAPLRQGMLGRLMPFFRETDPKVVGLFLVEFCSLGVNMTEPVSDWIRRAGENTTGKGYSELGRALVAHAGHEEGHHLMFIKDTRSLVSWWNDFHSPKLSADIFLQQPISPGVKAYRDLHETYISSDTPYCQIAIEYEIEKVSVDYGPKLFGHCAQVLGPQVLGCLSFVSEHVAVDIGHTQYNARALDRFLEHVPTAMEPLVRAGAQALDSYTSYIEDSVMLAKEFLAHA